MAFRIKSILKRYFREQVAAIIIVFALTAPILVATTGMALDYAMAYLVKQRLAQAIDAAALAGAANSSDPATITQKVQQFFDANYPSEKLGVTFDPTVVVDGDEVKVSGVARYDTWFLGVIGIDEIDVEAETTVQREVQGLEVVMVLDNTGSMSSNNNIGTLRTASKSFINILFNSTLNPNTIKIGMVPYSSSVRIGPYGLGENPDGTTYGDGYEFVTVPPDMTYTNDYTSYNWYGCVVEHNSTGYSNFASYVPNSKGQLWNDSGGNPDGHGWDPRDGDNDPYDSDVLDNYEGPWDVYSYGYFIPEGYECDDLQDYRIYGYNNSRCNACNGYGGNCTTRYCFCYQHRNSGGTNINCPSALIQPMISDRDDLLARVDTMSARGFTYGNIGMTWGWRLLSPARPFVEGSDWEDPYWRKAVVMMTDGDNTMEGTYSTYWATSRHQLDVNDLNERFEETCDALKELGVTIYTVTFTSNINDNTKGFYERCASSEDQYYDAPTQDELISVFEKISRELSQLYIKN
ncbi:MAG: pilus assembly protein [Micavibrio sp.]|nr:pilus assembly protein [Micavibrio sp.]